MALVWFSRETEPTTQKKVRPKRAIGTIAASAPSGSPTWDSNPQPQDHVNRSLARYHCASQAVLCVERFCATVAPARRCCVWSACALSLRQPGGVVCGALLRYSCASQAVLCVERLCAIIAPARRCCVWSACALPLRQPGGVVCGARPAAGRLAALWRAIRTRPQNWGLLSDMSSSRTADVDAA
jgi:hypothetical protein